MKKVLMLGPARSVKGGVSGVVNGYYEAGLDNNVELKYISTMHDKNNIIKLLYFFKAIFVYLAVVHKYDIIHIHMASRMSYRRKKVFISIAKWFNKEYIVHLHGAEFNMFYHDEASKSLQEQIRETFQQAKAVIVLSKSWKRDISIIAPDSNINVIYNSVTLQNLKVRENNNVLFLGRVGERKGIYNYLNIMPRLVTDFPDIKLYIGGDGDIPRLKQVLSNKHLAKNVEYVGWVTGDEKAKLFERCSTFILPSFNEGLPMAVLEAMSYSCAVITSTVGGIPEVVENDKNGFMVTPGDEDELLKVSLEILNNHEKRRLWAENAHKTIEKDFDINKKIKSLIRIYEM